MNSWMKSIIIGAIMAIVVYLISEIKDNQIRVIKYTIGCTIHAEPDTASRTQFSLSGITEVLKNRLDAADYKYEIKEEGRNNIFVSLSGMTDTLSPFPMLISNGRVQFREMYRLDDENVRQMLMTSVEEMNKIAATQKEKKKEEITVPAKRDNMSKEVSALLDSIEINKSNDYTVARGKELIEFSRPYENQTSTTSFPAEIGYVRLMDTTAVRNLLNLDKLKIQGPSDLQICFGQAQKPKTKKEDPIVPLYFIKTYGNEKALLENEDISSASADFNSNGKPHISLNFNQYGTKKWATMTSRNVNRPIAMIVNGSVISAPNVLSAIPNGISSISGDFTYDECKLLSIALKSNKLPATLRIASSTIKPDESDYKLNRKLLVAFISFVVTAGIAFFIFKTLKST